MTDTCGRPNRNGEPCQLPAGWGTQHSDGACKFHGGKTGRGASNPNYRHGAYSEYLKHDLTEPEQEAFDNLVELLEDPNAALASIRELAAEALLKYKRSGDSRFLREYRQLADTFNFAPNQDEVEVTGDGIVIYTESDGDDD